MANLERRFGIFVHTTAFIYPPTCHDPSAITLQVSARPAQPWQHNPKEPEVFQFFDFFNDEYTYASAFPDNSITGSSWSARACRVLRTGTMEMLLPGICWETRGTNQ